MIIPSNIIWFDDGDWLGLELSFPGGTRWKVTTKIRECEDLYSQKDHEEGGIVSEARAVFVASKVAGQAPPTAVLKIHMQVPWWGSATKRSSIRAQQAVAEPSARSENEVEALRLLTEAGCSSTPALIDWMNREQSQDQWIPGGYIHFIVMEMVPGVDVCFIIDDMDRGERDELRAAFKQSWLECISCGLTNLDRGAKNLRWDAARKKCYIIDWERHCAPEEDGDSTWRDANYLSWHLAWKGPCGTRNDMSTWEL
ncbi:hypothetical protein BDQ94DRAFT_185892 [Aspergillus welwitschiae]|uniref:Aminoglycoside phosphotransferase domain-containing protein n=2 Tax=Aspergillus TaxID=5052 RepID=A0A3F3QAP1_9EURO|nr:hypothetical protein BDQ94DRAFT_185892 [Aspergillus welwitschiae]RDH35862.1 hypothetical protein BDQ94DRAFT_185892 [Aspergillus welwitschiae]